MTLHKGILRQIQWRKMLSLCTQVNDSLGVKFSLYAHRHDWCKIFPLGIKAIFAILRQTLHDRSFSVLRRLKSYLRSIMSQPRLNHVMVLSIYKELLDELDLYAVANEFVGSSEYTGSVCLVPSLRGVDLK